MPSQSRKRISTAHTCCTEMKTQVSRCSLFSYPDTVSTKQAWTWSKRSSFAWANISPTWTSAPSYLNWSLSSFTSARMKLNVSTVYLDLSATMTPTSVTLTRPSSPTAPLVWPLETLQTDVAEESASWSPALTRTSLSFTLTGSCGYLLTFRSHTPSEYWMSIYWRATRSSTGLWLLDFHIDKILRSIIAQIFHNRSFIGWHWLCSASTRYLCHLEWLMSKTSGQIWRGSYRI